MGTYDNKEKFHPLHKRVENQIAIHFRTTTTTRFKKVLT